MASTNLYGDLTFTRSVEIVFVLNNCPLDGLAICSWCSRCGQTSIRGLFIKRKLSCWELASMLCINCNAVLWTRSKLSNWFWWKPEIFLDLKKSIQVIYRDEITTRLLNALWSEVLTFLEHRTYQYTLIVHELQLIKISSGHDMAWQYLWLKCLKISRQLVRWLSLSFPLLCILEIVCSRWNRTFS